MATSKVDKAAQRARFRADLRKEIVAAQSDSQVRTARERGKQRRAVEKTKTAQRVIERQQSEAARVAAYQQRSSIALDQANANRAARQSLNRQEKVEGAVTGSSAWHTIVMLTVIFFIMIFAYIIVHNGAAFGGLAGSVGNFIHGLSSTKPLFLKKPVDTNDDETPTNETNTGDTNQPI